MNDIIDYLIQHKEGLIEKIKLDAQPFLSNKHLFTNEFESVYRSAYIDFINMLLKLELSDKFSYEDIVLTIVPENIKLIIGEIYEF